MRYEWPCAGDAGSAAAIATAGAAAGSSGSSSDSSAAAVYSPLVLANPGPLGGAAAAQWLAHRLLPLPPGLLGGGLEGGPMLVMQVSLHTAVCSFSRRLCCALSHKSHNCNQLTSAAALPTRPS